ncbi:DegT/DnrJ/EryC1/StrS family aminotransferase [Candidatus Spongiihabitans sp.]|uniref:DegT/DnrJ/EryC1/StrS family aminotransferase n=1 Tax=Candidatus Spongiihabitans sp. TaxID=3101308 RepID=UPI003C6FCB81
MKFVDLDAQFNLVEKEIREAIDRVLVHKQFILGPEVGVFEQELKAYCGVKHVISAASGTDALLMALMAYGVGPGDGIIAPSFTFVATAEVIQLLGATTVFVDVDEATFNMDVARLEETIQTVKGDRKLNLKGIIAVDLFGLPADHDIIQAIADQHGLFVVSDAAQSFGAEYKNKKAGVFGNIATTSFFPSKPLGCYGDGGAVFTDNQELADIVESIRFHGKGHGKNGQYENTRIGITGRLDTLQAAILSCKLKIFNQELDKRQVIADIYRRELNDVVITPTIPPGYKSSWSVYTIRSAKRDNIRRHFNKNGIPSAVYYPSPLHRQPAFKNALGGGQMMPVTDRLADEVLSLPIHPYLQPDDQMKIIAAVKTAVG